MALLTVAAVAVAGLALAPVASAVEDVETTRLAGTDRFATAAEVAKAAYPNGADNVIIASGRAFPDALAGAALAGVLNAPVLLTERDRLPSATSGAVRELGADHVYILGGTAAVSQNVQNSFELANYQTTRIAGDDRYETAAEIGRRIGGTNVSDLDALPTAFVATGLNFADALAGGPLAGAGAGTGVHPILLVNTDVPADTEAAITELGIKQVVILGGTSVVSASVEAKLEQLTGNDAVRLAGNDRYATAVEVAKAAVADFGFTTEEVLLANGVVFADALAGGPLGAVRQAPILLTPATALSATTAGYLEDESATVERITVLGGTAAVADSVMQAAEEAAEAAPPEGANETVTVTPTSDEDVANGETREYTATALTAPVDIVLVECADITTDADGNTVFPNTNTNAIADRTAREGTAPDLAQVENAYISSVNGTPRSSVPTVAEPNNDYANNVQPADGVVTFVVSGPSGSAANTAAVCVIPVVLYDANADNSLNSATTNPAKPTEEFGTGGSTTFTPAAAAAGQFGAHNVSGTGLDKTINRFTACAITAQPNNNEVVNTDDCKTFRYDDNDVFQITSNTVTMAVWEQALSPDDDVQGSYAATASGVSTFNLTDEAPVPPSTVQAEAVSNSNDVQVSWNDSSTSTNDFYRIFRTTLSDAALDCPTEATPYAKVGPDIADTGSPSFPATMWTYRDETTANATTYCYRVAGVDEGDQGAMSAPDEVTSGTDPAVGPPQLVQASQSQTDPKNIDVSWSDSTSSGVTAYKVYRAGPVTGGESQCPDSTTGRTSYSLQTTVENSAAPAHQWTDPVQQNAVTYCYAVSSVAGTTEGPLSNEDGATTAAAAATPTDTTGPQITTAAMNNDSGVAGFGQAGDVMALTFNENVTETDEDNQLSEEEIKALLGVMTIDYHEPSGGTLATLVTISASGDTVTLTAVTGMNVGVPIGTAIPGTNNGPVDDTAGNQMVANSANPPLQTAS